MRQKRWERIMEGYFVKMFIIWGIIGEKGEGQFFTFLSSAHTTYKAGKSTNENFKLEFQQFKMHILLVMLTGW